MDDIKPQHFSVSWRPILEGFFRDYAWTVERIPETFRRNFSLEDKFGKYQKEVDFDMWAAKRAVEGKTSCKPFYKVSLLLKKDTSSYSYRGYESLCV